MPVSVNTLAACSHSVLISVVSREWGSPAPMKANRGEGRGHRRLSSGGLSVLSWFVVGVVVGSFDEAAFVEEAFERRIIACSARNRPGSRLAAANPAAPSIRRSGRSPASIASCRRQL
jgi:hypothetical protein